MTLEELQIEFKAFKEKVYKILDQKVNWKTVTVIISLMTIISSYFSLSLTSKVDEIKDIVRDSSLEIRGVVDQYNNTFIKELSSVKSEVYRLGKDVVRLQTVLDNAVE